MNVFNVSVKACEFQELEQQCGMFYKHVWKRSTGGWGDDD